MPLTIILVECGLELIPRNMRNHPSIKKQLVEKNYRSQLLDNALHHSAMKTLKNSNKRGRPDILHACILNALGSPLNKSGNLRLYVHTIKNKIFKFNPEIKITRNYNRFKGLMAKLLIDGNISFEKSELISSIKGNLNQLLELIKDKELIIFSSKGRLINDYKTLFPKPLSKNYVALVGGFQKNTLSSDILALSDNIISISRYSLDAWIVISKILNIYEILHEIQ
ncbi:MAG: hypothetical protein ACFFBP_10745 [Promethearchaeota archaeon]